MIKYITAENYLVELPIKIDAMQAYILLPKNMGWNGSTGVPDIDLIASAVHDYFYAKEGRCHLYINSHVYPGYKLSRRKADKIYGKLVGGVRGWIRYWGLRLLGHSHWGESEIVILDAENADKKRYSHKNNYVYRMRADLSLYPVYFEYYEV